MMGTDFQFRDKVPVAILGATGAVGQRFVSLLAKHPWFEIKTLAASAERSAGKYYRDAVNWIAPTSLSDDIAQMKVVSCDTPFSCPLIFSALDSSVAGPLETRFAEEGNIIVSNSRNHRMDPDVPLLIPEINTDHLDVINTQKFPKGKIITNPNCSTIGLAIALKPLLDAFGIEAVHVVTMQAVSGAGYPGVASLDIVDNVLPYIEGEEHKIETETLKILGSYEKGMIKNGNIKISAQCNRVAVSDGHLACVSVKFKHKPSKKEIIDAWRSFKGQVHELGLPSSPEKLIHYFEEIHYPQPRLHRTLDKGMALSIGRLRECPIMDYKFVILSHNTIRGAAGGALLIGELLLKQGRIFW